MKKLFFFLATICLSIATMAQTPVVYRKVTDAASLQAGDCFILVNEANSKASGAITNNKYFSAVNVSLNNGVATCTDAQELILGGTTGAFTLTANGKAVGVTGTSNDLSFGSSAQNTFWSIAIVQTSGEASITNNTASPYLFAYNNSGAGRFTAYKPTSNQAPVCIYKRTAGDNPSLSIGAITFSDNTLDANGSASDTQSLTITTADLGTANLAISLTNGSVFSLSSTSLPSTGGSINVSYNASTAGAFTDTIVVAGTTPSGESIYEILMIGVVIAPYSQGLPEGVMVSYNRLQNISDLHEGDKVFFAPNRMNTDLVMGLYDYDVSKSNIHCETAVFDAARHQVTALDTYAYTVHITADGKYQFVGVDGAYLYMYNTNKNLSSTSDDTNSDKAKWSLSIANDVATIKNVYSSTFTLAFNHTALPQLFCTYANLDANNDLIELYASAAPAYQEKELQPSITTNVDTIYFTDATYDEIDKVFFDNYTLTVVGTDLLASITPTITGDTVFNAYTTLSANGGQLSVYFESDEVGRFDGILTLTSGETTKRIVLVAIVEASVADPTPRINVQDTLFVRTDLATFDTSDEQMATLSVATQNITSMVYFSIVDSLTEQDDAYFDLKYADRLPAKGGNIDIYYFATETGVYNAVISLYAFGDKNDKNTKVSKNVVVRLTIFDDNNPDPKPDPDPNPNPGTEPNPEPDPNPGTETNPDSKPNDPATDLSATPEYAAPQKVLREGQIYILHNGSLYTTSGQRCR